MKKLSALLICLLMFITCSLTGCAGFSINRVKYYNEVLATVDETKITRFDLLTAYKNYGQSYYTEQMGQNEKEALSNTLDLLIDHEALYQYAVNYTENDKKIYKPTAYQVNEIVQEIFDSVDKQMAKYVETSKQILNIKEDEDTEVSTEDSKVYKFENYTYTKRAKVEFNAQTNEYEIKYITPKEELKENLIPEMYLNNFTSKNTINAIKTKYFEHFLDELEIDEKENANIIYNKARSLFANDLIDYEYYLRDQNGKKFSTVTEDLFDRYFKRTFESQIQSQYLENIRIHFLENEKLSLQLIEDEYKYLAKLNYNSYNQNHTAYKNTMKDIGTNGNNVLYHPETDTQFGYFIHTLISSDTIKDNLKLLDDYYGDDKDEIYNNILSSITVQARDLTTGKVEDGTKEETLSEVLEKYEQIRITDYGSDEAKMSAFIQFMFKYTGDTATLSQGMPYVVGTNGYSAMVEEFNNEAILLMTGKNAKGETVMEGKAGNMSIVDLENINNMCVTDYGIHLIYYIGNVNAYDIPYEDTNSVYIATENQDDNGMYNLYHKIINPLNNKTYFDMMFDLVYPANSSDQYTSNTGYSDYEEQLTETSKQIYKVIKNKTKIKGTKTNL